MNPSPPKSDLFLRIIAIFKLVKATLFFTAAVGILHLLHKDVEAWLQTVLDNTHVDPDNRIARWLLDQAGKLTNTKVVSLSAIAFFYGCLFATEGFGLYFRKAWGEYMVVIVTGSLLPLEFYELCHKPNAAKAALIVCNLAILVYLIYVIRRNRKNA